MLKRMRWIVVMIALAGPAQARDDMFADLEIALDLLPCARTAMWIGELPDAGSDLQNLYAGIALAYLRGLRDGLGWSDERITDALGQACEAYPDLPISLLPLPR